MSWLSRVAGNFARQIVRTLVRMYYPKIEVTDRARIPGQGAVLFVANHPNSLMDPVVIGIAAQRPVHFLAKAPLFEVPVFGQMLEAMGMLPAYRGSDDASQLKRNLDSISAAAAFLVKGEALGIFPEGKSHDLMKVEQVRSGAARMALQAVRDGATNLSIVPVGINYQQKERFRSAVWVRVGNPIEVNAWIKEHGEDERQATRALTLEIGRRLKEVVVNLDEEKWEVFLNDLEALYPPPRENARNPIAVLHQRKRIADAMNHFASTDRPRAEAMAGAIEEHRRKLAAVGLTVQSDIFRLQGLPLTTQIIREALGMSCGFVVVLAGTLHHLLPFWLTRILARLVRAPGRSTIALSRLLLGLPIYAAWYAFTWWWMAKYFLPWVASAWLVPMPLAGIMALHFWTRVGRAGRRWWPQLRMLARPGDVRRWRADQEELRKRLRALAEEFARIHPPAPLPSDTFSRRRFAAFSARGIAIGLILLYAGAWSLGWFRDNTISELENPGLEVSRISLPALRTSLDADEKALSDMIEGVRDLEAKAARLQAEFANGKRSFYNQADDDAVRQLLLSYLTYRTSLLGLAWKYQQHAEVQDEQLRWRAFLCSFGAASTLYDASLKFVTRFQHSPETLRKLNEPEPNWNIPAGVYDMIKRHLLQVKVQEYMSAAWKDYRAAQSRFEELGLAQSRPYDSFHAAIRRHAESRVGLRTLLVEASLSNPVKDVQQAGRQVTYRAQSFVSTWMGNTRIRQPRGGRALIQPEELQKMRLLLKPGDILIERQNWYLSRAFMPGFWAHAALYAGTTNDLIRLGLDQDERVRRYWKQFAARDDSGHEYVILEAVPQGVRMTTFEHCLGVADSAAVLRPRLSEKEVREAIARAFSHLGKPYDFEFDFFSTDKLVCTELVCRAYDANIKFPLVDVLGRKTMPPTELVRKYVQERGRPEAQLECVCFLDGQEAKGKARFRDEAAFVATLQRPGLTWLQPRSND